MDLTQNIFQLITQKFVFKGIFKLICAKCKYLNLKNLSVVHGDFKYVGFSPWISHMSENNNKPLNSSLYSFPVSFCHCMLLSAVSFRTRLILSPFLLDTQLHPLQSYP